MFGEKLRSWAKENFGSLTKLAEALNIQLPTLHNYVTGKNEPGMQFFIKLQNLGCDISWLLSEDDKDPPPPDVVDKVKELEEENRLLRDRISQISILTQVLEQEKTKKPYKKS